jgi:hypothetical protein
MGAGDLMISAMARTSECGMARTCVGWRVGVRVGRVVGPAEGLVMKHSLITGCPAGVTYSSDFASVLWLEEWTGQWSGLHRLSDYARVDKTRVEAADH